MGTYSSQRYYATLRGAVRKDACVAAVYEQRSALLRRVATLPDAQWDALCPVAEPPPGVIRLEEPTRTVRQVVAHVLVVDELVLRSPLRLVALRRLEHPGGWDLRRVEPLAAKPPTELATMLARRGERVGRLVAAAPAPVQHVPVPFGRRESLGRFIARRVLHEWLHEHDIAAATEPDDVPKAPAPVVAAAITEAVLGQLPSSALARSRPERGVVRLVVEPGGGGGNSAAEPRVWGVDFAERLYGPRVTAPPDATIRLDAATLALLAHGRRARLRDERRVQFEGDEALARDLVGALSASGVTAPCVGSAVTVGASSR